MHLELMRDDSRVFPSPSTPAEVDTLRVWHCKYRTLNPISELSNLRGLEVATYPDESFDVVSGLQGLRYLRVLHLPRIADLGPLASLANLEVLSLATLPSWDASNRVVEVASLRPLAELSKLRHLELFGVRPHDAGLRSLETSRSLRSVRVSKYPKAEVARFRQAAGVSDDFAPNPWF